MPLFYIRWSIQIYILDMKHVIIYMHIELLKQLIFQDKLNDQGKQPVSEYSKFLYFIKLNKFCSMRKIHFPECISVTLQLTLRTSKTSQTNERVGKNIIGYSKHQSYKHYFQRKVIIWCLELWDSMKLMLYDEWNFLGLLSVTQTLHPVECSQFNSNFNSWVEWELISNWNEPNADLHQHDLKPLGD